MTEKPPIIYVTGTLKNGLAETLDAHTNYVKTLCKSGVLALSVVRLLAQTGRTDGWLFIARNLIPHATEVHVLAIETPDNKLIRPVSRDIKFASQCNIPVKFIDAQKYLSTTAESPTKST